MSTSFKTIAEVCDQFRIGKTKAYQLINSGAFRTKKIGTKTLIDTSSIDEWVQTLPGRETANQNDGGRNV